MEIIILFSKSYLYFKEVVIVPTENNNSTQSLNVVQNMPSVSVGEPTLLSISSRANSLKTKCYKTLKEVVIGQNTDVVLASAVVMKLVQNIKDSICKSIAEYDRIMSKPELPNATELAKRQQENCMDEFKILTNNCNGMWKDCIDVKLIYHVLYNRLVKRGWIKE